MIVRSIKASDVERFEIICVEKPLKLQKWLEAGRTKLEWCYVVEEDGVFKGRAIFGVFPEQPLEVKLWQIVVPGGVSDVYNYGQALVSESVENLLGMGITSVEYHLYSQGLETFDAYKAIFSAASFDLAQEKNTYVFTGDVKGEIADSLQFKTLEAVGEPAFVEAIEAVSSGTLDRDDQESIAVHGSAKAAKLYFDLLEDMTCESTWWQLAYNEASEFVGLVVPQSYDENTGVINYIGVCPEQRGNGYVKQLIKKGLATLNENGLNSVIADIDVENFPLAKALLDLGFEKTSELLVFRKR